MDFYIFKKPSTCKLFVGSLNYYALTKKPKFRPPPPPPRSHLFDFGNPLPPANVQNFTLPPLSTTIINQYLNRAIL